MEKHHEIYDTITVMNGYNFDKPINISVIIEDNERAPNQSKTQSSDYGKNNSMSTSLQDDNRYKNYVMHQQNSCIRNKPRKRSEISPAQRFSYNGNERNLDGGQRHISSNNVVNTTYTENFHSCRGLVSGNIYTREKSPSVYNGQQSEFILINTIAENLALIMEAYVHFCTLISKSKDEQYVSHLRAKCLRVKLNLFYKCMVMSKDFLLQHENNQKFITKLLQRAKQISKVTLPSKHYEHLYEEMLKWIRLKSSKTTKNNYQNTINNENFAAHMVHQASNPVSKPISENRPVTNIFSSGPLGSQVTISIDPKILEQQRIRQNMLDYATDDLSYLQTNNIERHHCPYSNNSPLCENSQQNKQPNALWSNSTYYTQTQYAQNNSCNTRFARINQVDSREITRRSISRDSGFISPVMSVSPSEYYFNDVQQPSVEYTEQRTIDYGMPNASSFEPNVAIEGLPFWNNV